MASMRCCYIRLLFTDIGSTNMQYYCCMKVELWGKHVTIDILVDNETGAEILTTSVVYVCVCLCVFSANAWDPTVVTSPMTSSLRRRLKTVASAERTSSPMTHPSSPALSPLARPPAASLDHSTLTSHSIRSSHWLCPANAACGFTAHRRLSVAYDN